ncbi:MAG: response regulator [Thermoplasmata archaeon]
MDEKVLIVEDEKIVAQDIKNKLQDLGYSVPGIVDNGEEAVKIAGKEELDIVLMDIKLKGEMDGIEAAQQIKEFDVPVIYLTAYANDDLLERAKVTEPFGYIVKPFEAQDLKIGLKMGLYKHKMERKLDESREKYRTLFNNAGIPMLLMNDDGEVTLVNDEINRSFNHGGAYVKEGMKFTELLAEEDVRNLDRHLYLMEIEDEETPKHLELTLCLGEENKNVFSTVKSLPGNDEKVMSLLEVSVYDTMIDELKKVEELFKMGFAGGYDFRFPTGLSNFFGEDYFDHVKSSCLNELLLLLITLRGRASGSQLLTDINTLFGTSLNPSMMYPRLRKMNESGLLELIEKPKTKEYRLKERSECMRMITEKIENLFKVNIVLKFLLNQVEE